MLRPLIWRTLVANSGITVLGLANSVLLSRWLGPTGRGEVAAAMLWPTLLIYLSSMGLISSVLYFASSPDARPKQIFGSSISLAGVQSATALAVSFFALPWLMKSQTSAVISAGRLYLLVIPLSLISQYGISILQARLKMSAFNLMRSIIPIGYLIGTLVLVVFGQLVLHNIIVLHLILNVAVLAGTLAALSRAGIHPEFPVAMPLAKRLLKYGAKVQVGEVSQIANLRLDQVLMAAFLPAVYLGVYVAAVSAAGLVQLLSLAVRMVVVPNIVQRESVVERTVVLEAVFRRYWLLSLVFAVGLAAILPWAIPLVFGAGFQDAILPSEILVVGALFIGAKDVLSAGAQALGDPWLSSRADMIALVVTVVLLVILLPTLGIVGAAIATTTAYGTALLLMVHGLRRTHRIVPTELFRIRLRDLSPASYVRSSP
ncbi:MAG: polysaccharide biosynthesis C-terminal domain-containing protein [Blastocatellia bacterium]